MQRVKFPIFWPFPFLAGSTHIYTISFMILHINIFKYTTVHKHTLAVTALRNTYIYTFLYTWVHKHTILYTGCISTCTCICMYRHTYMYTKLYTIVHMKSEEKRGFIRSHVAAHWVIRVEQKLTTTMGTQAPLMSFFFKFI